MENQGFKSSLFGGFDKKTVLSYVFELNENAQEAQQKLTEQLEDLNSSRDELSKSLADAESRIAEAESAQKEVSSKLEEENQKNAELTRRIESLEFENKKQTQIIEVRDGEIARLSELNAGLEEKNRILEDKRGQVELAASQISSLLKQSRKDADRMMEQARDEAEKIISVARSEASQISKDARARADGMLKKANGSLDGIYKQFDAFCKELGGVQQHMIDTVSMMNAKLKTVNRAAAKARDTATDNIVAFNAVVNAEQKQPQPAETEQPPETSMKLADDILSQYGIHKDESGFFRLTSEE